MPKCSECGFLALRIRATGETREADEELRETGYYDVPDGKRCVACPTFCWAGGDWFPKVKIRSAMTGAPIAEVLQAERDCGKYMPWIPGRMPAEHERLMWQDMIEARERATELRIAEAAAKAELLDQRRRAEDIHWRWVMLIASLVGAIVCGLLSGSLGAQLTRWFGS